MWIMNSILGEKDSIIRKALTTMIQGCSYVFIVIPTFLPLRGKNEALVLLG